MYRPKCKGKPTPINIIASDAELEPHERLALCIVMQALDDLALVLKSGKSCMKTKTSDYLDRDDLRAFFGTRWCNVLLCTTGISGKELLEKMDI